MPLILVVDDEPQIRKALSVNLRARGYDVDLAATGEEALQRAAARPPDLVLLDLGVPGIDGVDVVEGLRAWTHTPIIILSVRDTERDKVRALDAGADDYVTKPFGIDEVLARMRAALRRSHAEPVRPIIRTAAFELDLAERRATRAGAPVHLTPTEWEIIAALALRPGRLVTQRHLLQEVWGPQYERETNYLRVHLAAIRKKLEPQPSQPRYFLTEPGIGYRFEPGDEP